MQNQRKNGRPDAAVRMAGLFLVLFCVAAVLIPAKTLFTGNGFFADYIHFTESKRMYVEIAILAVLIFGGSGEYLYPDRYYSADSLVCEEWYLDCGASASISVRQSASANGKAWRYTLTFST